MSSRASAITAAGIVLSQPTMQTRPSNRCPSATSSIESAITSRETSDARIPAVPIETPSETEIVLNSSGVPPPSRTPCFKYGAHVLPHVLVDDVRADRVRAVLGRVGDRVVHPLDPALPDQVDDQLQLVQALVVGDFGLVTGFDERLEAELDQLGDAAAEHGLLAEEIRLGLLRERGLDHA